METFKLLYSIFITVVHVIATIVLILIMWGVIQADVQDLALILLFINSSFIDRLSRDDRD